VTKCVAYLNKRRNQTRVYCNSCHHCYGPRIQPCPFYDTIFDYTKIPYWRSVGSVGDVTMNIERFLTPAPEPDQAMFDCLDVVFQLLDHLFDGKIVPLSLRRGIEMLPNDTSPGFPYVCDKIFKKKEIKHRLINDYKAIISKVPVGSVCNYPCLTGLRLSLVKKPANKPRVVWVYPATMALAEARFYSPLMARLFKCLIFSWDFSYLRGEVDEILHFTKAEDCVLGMDVSAYDATVPRANIERIFKWMKSKFLLTKQEDHDFRVMSDYFIHTPLWYKNTMFMKHRGVPSGSFFTQMIDSINNLAYLVRMAQWIQQIDDIKFYNVQSLFKFCRVLGDDSCVVPRVRWLKPAFANCCQYFATNYGIVIHPDKGFFISVADLDEDDLSDRPPPVNFLGFDLHPTFPPFVTKPVELVYAQCLFPEEKEKDPSISMARIIGIKWCSGDDPEILSVTNFFWKLLKDRYPEIEPGELPNEYRLMLKFVFGNAKVEKARLPTDEEVIARYRSPSAYLRSIYYSTNRYWDYIGFRWKPLDYYKIKVQNSE